MEKKRSKGVAFLGFWLIVQGVAFFVIPIVENIPSGLIIGLPIVLIIIFMGIGILKLVNWIRIMAVILHIMGGLFCLATATIAFFNQPIVAIPLLIPLTIFIGIVYFFTRPKVKEQFR